MPRVFRREAEFFLQSSNFFADEQIFGVQTNFDDDFGVLSIKREKFLSDNVLDHFGQNCLTRQLCKL